MITIIIRKFIKYEICYNNNKLLSEIKKVMFVWEKKNDLMNLKLTHKLFFYRYEFGRRSGRSDGQEGNNKLLSFFLFRYLCCYLNSFLHFSNFRELFCYFFAAVVVVDCKLLLTIKVNGGENRPRL